MRAYRPAFLAVDLNNDGSLSWQEYVTVLRSEADAAASRISFLGDAA